MKLEEKGKQTNTGRSIFDFNASKALFWLLGTLSSLEGRCFDGCPVAKNTLEKKFVVLNVTCSKKYM